MRESIVGCLRMIGLEARRRERSLMSRRRRINLVDCEECGEMGAMGMVGYGRFQNISGMGLLGELA